MKLKDRLQPLEARAAKEKAAQEKKAAQPYFEVLGDETEAELIRLARENPGKKLLLIGSDEWFDAVMASWEIDESFNKLFPDNQNTAQWFETMTAINNKMLAEKLNAKLKQENEK